MSAPSPSQLLYERLLFDAELRERFRIDRETVLHTFGLPQEAAQRFLDLDLQGLRIDAEGRRRYLMSALCRPYPLTAAGLGASPGGAERLSAFLASPRLFGALADRTRAFGDHLGRLLSLNAAGLAPPLVDLLQATLGLERALVDNAAALREAAAQDRAPGPPATPTRGQLKRRRLTLPPFFLAAELPAPTAMIRAALSGVGPEDAWHRIAGGGLELGRLLTVARADDVPVSLLCRGYVRGVSAERSGAGGVSPLVDVRHARVELSGRQSALLRMLQDRPTLAGLPPARQGLVRRLVEAGVVGLD